MAPRLSGTWRTEAQKVWIVRRPVPWVPAISPTRAVNRGPYPAACSGGTGALVHCAHMGHQASCNTQCVTSIWMLTITHNCRELRERPKRQVVDNKKGVADNML